MTKPSIAADFHAYICGVNGVCTNSVYRETPEEVCQQFGEASIVSDYLGTVSGTSPEYYDGGCDLIDLQFGNTYTLKVFTF